MCYSGTCVWEGYMGDCTYTRHIKEISDIYGLCFNDATINQYLKVNKMKIKIFSIKNRKNKIKVIKNKISIKKVYI